MNEPLDPKVASDVALSFGTTVSELAHGSARDTAPFGPGKYGHSGDLPTLPGYRVLREIARGGMGRVLVAHEIGLDRDVAIKTLLPGADGSRFVRESRITAKLPHPGIPPVYGLGSLSDGTPFLAMKLIEGRTLAAEMKVADRPRLLRAFTQICEAVGFAHSRGVIHRDLKPSNVMVGAFGEVQVMDWGLAKDMAPNEHHETTSHDSPQFTDDDGSQTQAGQVMGTPNYMAPEQARGESADARTDVFALGGILCAILTGKPPFGGKSSAEAIQRAASADLAEAYALLEGCGVDAEVVLLGRRCLSANTDDRPKDGQAVADAMIGYQNGVQERLKAAEIAGAEANERAKAERRTRRIQMIAAGLVLLVLAGGVVGTSIGLVKASWAQEKAVFAEGEERKRADELEKVSGFQAEMLQQVDATEAGVQLMVDLRARHAKALDKAKLTGAEKAARLAALDRELVMINSTDAAVGMLDRMVLLPAVQAIDSKFTDQPLVDASLRSTLGNVYSALGRSKESLPLYQRSHDERRTLLGEEHADTLKSQIGVGRAQGELQHFAEAEAAIRASLRVYERDLGADHKDTLDTQSLLALQMQHQGKYDEAVSMTREILQLRRHVQGEDHVDTLQAKSDLGRYLVAAGKYADAVQVLQEVVAARRSNRDAGLASDLASLGSVLLRRKEYAAAETHIREALELRRKKLGDDHPSTLSAMSTLASLLMIQENFGEGEALAKELVDKCRRHQGSDHAETLAAINILGQVYFRQNKYRDAEPFYREALSTGRRMLGEDHPDTIIWMANYGHLLVRLGRLPEAEQHLREATEKNRKQLGEHHPYTLSIVRNLADIYRQQNKLAEAEAYLRPHLEATRRAYGDDHQESISLMSFFAALLRDEGKLTEAEVLLRQTLDASRRLFGEGHANTITAVLRMGSLHVAQGKYQDALSVLVPVEGKIQKAIPGMTGVLRNASLIGLIGKCQGKLAKTMSEFAASEAKLLESESIFAKHRGDKDIETRKARQDLIQFYVDWHAADPERGLDAKAAEWKRRLGTTSK